MHFGDDVIPNPIPFPGRVVENSRGMDSVPSTVLQRADFSRSGVTSRGLRVVGRGEGLVFDAGSGEAVDQRLGMLERALREREAHLRAEVARENASARRLDAGDARRILAVRTSEALEGGAGAILRPDRRRAILDLAQEMGLRAFDANLIIAIVQDSARRGIGVEHSETSGRLELVGGAERGDLLDRKVGGVWLAVAWAVCVGSVAGAWLIGWVMGKW